MDSSQRDFTATEIRAGFLVLASLVILAVFFVALSGWHPVDRSARHYYAAFANVGGLNVGAEVRFGGVKVGRVAAIEPDPADRTQIRVALEVKEDTPVNGGSVASIEQVTLTAEKHLEISTGAAAAPLLPDGSTLKTRANGGGLIEMPELEGVVARLEVLLDGLNALVGPEPAKGAPSSAVNLRTLFGSMKTTLDEGAGAARRVNTLIDENQEGIREVVRKLAALGETGDRLLRQLDGVVSENGPAIHRSVVNLERLTEEMDARMADLSAALESIQELGANGSDLLEDQRPAIEEILLNLQVMTRHLAELSRVLADKPNAMVFGAVSADEPKGERR